MIKKLKELLKVTLVTAAFMVPVAVPAVASAQDDAGIQSGLCSGSQLQFDTSGSGGCESGGSEAGDKLNNLIRTVINVVSIVVGVVAVIMIIFGGLKYITSGGDSSNVSAAKNTIIYAIVGLVVVALAQFIVQFVLEKTINGGGN